MILYEIRNKWKRNVAIYKDAYKKGKIAGFDYTLLLWKVHTKFLLRIRNPKDRQKVFERLEKFWEGFADVIYKYKDQPVYPQSNLSNDDTESTIWVYWNDVSNMPQMVSSCINLIRKNSNGCKVVVVTESTVPNYLHLDEIVWQKYRDGKISRTHFSDIVRIALLVKYGGVWMDCTLLLTQPLPKIVTSSDFYTNRLNVKDDINICAGRWSTFFLACHKNNLLMRAALDVFNEYWKRYDDIVDYVWMDYIFNMLYKKIPSIKKMIDSVPYNNPNIWILQTMVSKPYSEQEFKNIFADKSRFLYKLSYKDSIGIPLHDKNGTPTLLGRICGEK